MFSTAMLMNYFLSSCAKLSYVWGAWRNLSNLSRSFASCAKSAIKTNYKIINAEKKKNTYNFKIN